MTPALRPELKELPLRMAELPLDERGYPVPWFVEWIDGKPEFRVMDGRKWTRAVRERLCWVCGRKLGAWLTFVVGPMCGINRTTSEPPSHRECARWSAQNCPFLSRPKMTRRDFSALEELGAKQSIGGAPILRNPGVSLLWVTRSFETWKPDDGGILIRLGDPEELEWYSEGRTATLAEIRYSIDTGIPLLEEVAQQQGPEAMTALHQQIREFEALLPKE